MLIYVTHIANLSIPQAGVSVADTGLQKGGYHRHLETNNISLGLYRNMREPDAPYNTIRANKARYQREDILYKGILEDLFEDFLRFMIPDAESHFDFNRKFEFLSQELEQLFPPQDDVYKARTIDKLVKVFTKNGAEEWVFIHIEIQDKYDEDFSHRMYTYYSRIFDKHEKSITAFAILTEAVHKSRSNTFRRSYLGTSLVYTYNVLKISQQDENQLEASDNPFAMVLLIAKAALKGKKLDKKNRDAFLMEVKIKLAKHLLTKKMATEKIGALLQFLTYHIRFDDQTNTKMFEQELNKITERKTTMGIKELLLDLARHEGELKGELKKQLEIAREMKNDKFPIETIVRLTKLSAKQIKAL